MHRDKKKRAVLHPEHGTFATRTITTLEDPSHSPSEENHGGGHGLLTGYWTGN